ncbi:hypothetical protein M406DRAFT_281836 [Cryphonectria parasitica EP155]|uniref:Protein Zds1 C-terminal domain-containing protein n=1 Tax=Cryphonectria parasitica (strain ATCC 38755 / EP155) TaxID=660469 RepID=A0A9P5CL18_CRYP1|nr:uncharacterized protein M406DRAFT_281836 [Cryphonectria parasitica EP155]KAF3761762.1 hypothetical protein M406DRAFT_281836 [Cryphonectria parasitica EP155]
MMTSSRPRDVGGSFASRRGHANTLSISDPSHHVTEAIGTLYGSDDNDSDTESRENRKSRPLSFLSYGEDQLPSRTRDTGEPDDPRRALQRSQTDTTHLSPQDANTTVKKSNTMPSRMSIQRMPSSENGPMSPSGPMSPTPSLRDFQAAESSMPMTNIDNPRDIAQELSNLQALRRMSMDVGSDPDLMPFQGIVPIPSIAPTGDDDESDPSRLLWVPANVHPELAPEQFKSFLERRVTSMKRRSGESMLSAEGVQRNDSFGLRRTKSKLSRQIDNSGGRGGEGYVDGAERLERQKSLNGYATPELSLDELVKDPTKAVQKLTKDASEGASSDVILPVAPGMGLRRSTRTQYRKGGSMRGDRSAFSKRMAQKLSDTQEEPLPPMPTMDAPPGPGISRVQTEPVSTENFSRPKKSIKRQQGFSRETPPQIVEPSATQAFESAPEQQEQQSHGRSASDPEETVQAVEHAPYIEQTPQFEQLDATRQFPERSSSQSARAQHSQESQAPPVPQHRPQERTMNDITSPGHGPIRTDNLTMVPTFTAESDRKKRDSDGESTKSSSGWKWFKSEDKKKKEKEKEREKERDEQARRSKSTKAAEKPHEIARLDVLQNSIENVVAKGRESLLLDRDSVDSKLQEERKKDTSRKSSDGRKEKDGFFGSIFGNKKKSERDSSSRKQLRPPSPEAPPPRLLKPDVDYPYTRFPILEERAIYRMAHIKLANPKRNLLSQVLLSNFMYSYLAKIQAMHPQLQVPVSPQQKRLEEERQRKEQEAQQAYMEQQMQQQQSAQNSIDQYNFEYHRSSNQYGDSEGDYVDENGEPYDYDQGQAHGGYEGHHGQDGGYRYGHDAYGQQQLYYDGHDHQRHQDEDEMW